MAIACGFLLAALHVAGLATLTHTPSPMPKCRSSRKNRWSRANPQYPSSWTPDGRSLAFAEGKPNGERDIWVAEQGVDPSPILMTASDEWAPTFSRDGRWAAYVSNESGRPDVYVQPYPRPGGRGLISTAGGSDPVWSPDGMELFYLQGIG